MNILRISLKNSFIYRSSTIFNIIGSAIQIFICITLWKYIYKQDAVRMNYMVLYTIISNVIGVFYANELGNEIAGKISDGSFAMELVKPVSFIYLGYWKMVGGILAKLMTRGIPILIFFSPYIIPKLNIIDYRQLPLALLAILLGHILYCLMFALVGFIAFVCFEIWTFNRMLSDTIRFLSGSFIPLALFPKRLQGLIEILPFKYLYAFPLQLVLESVESGEIMRNMMILVLWVVFFSVFLRCVYKRAVNKLVVQGG